MDKEYYKMHSERLFLIDITFFVYYFLKYVTFFHHFITINK